MRARAVVREQLFASNYSNMEADIWLHWIVYNNMRTLPWSLCVCVVAWTLQKHTKLSLKSPVSDISCLWNVCWQCLLWEDVYEILEQNLQCAEQRFAVLHKTEDTRLQALLLS